MTPNGLVSYHCYIESITHKLNSRTIGKGSKTGSDSKMTGVLKTDSGLQPNGHPEEKTASLQEPSCQ